LVNTVFIFRLEDWDSLKDIILENTFKDSKILVLGCGNAGKLS
jgi:hypothetical protein